MVAAAGSLLVGLALIALAAASLAAGHGSFSGGVGIALVVYGVAMAGGAFALWQGSIFGRGPVVAMALLNVVAGYTFTGVSALGVAARGGVGGNARRPQPCRAPAAPCTCGTVSSGDEPPQKADQGT